MATRRAQGIAATRDPSPAPRPESDDVPVERMRLRRACRERPALLRVLESATKAQRIVPDAVAVGGSATARWASHRSPSITITSSLIGLRVDSILEAIEATDRWVTNRVTQGTIVLGSLGGIETGAGQDIRKRPFEVTEAQLPSGE